MTSLFLAALITLAAMLLGAGVLHLIPRLGPSGQRLSDALTRAPLLDILITYFTIAPLIFGPIFAGWWGLAGAVLGQVGAVLIWGILHEAAHPEARDGPRIVKVVNRLVGPTRNHAAIWITALVVPMFWIVRMAELIVYPPLTWLVRLPPYNHADWVNVSRHKFKGLVGHDLIWCLYCDWMTGVWSLGSEMLRTVESFLCPIRFASDKKCEYCRHDFPDIAAGWVRADADIASAAALVEQRYTADPRKPDADAGGAGRERWNAWFGHPARLTVHGAPTAPTPEDAPARG